MTLDVAKVRRRLHHVGSIGERIHRCILYRTSHYVPLLACKLIAVEAIFGQGWLQEDQFRSYEQPQVPPSVIWRLQSGLSPIKPPTLEWIFSREVFKPVLRQVQ